MCWTTFSVCYLLFVSFHIRNVDFLNLDSGHNGVEYSVYVLKGMQWVLVGEFWMRMGGTIQRGVFPSRPGHPAVGNRPTRSG